MNAILVESALFVAFLAALGALVVSLFGASRFGTRARQIRNRRRMERIDALTCPVHGPRDERDLVRLPGGATICPDCYQETLDGKFV